MISLILLLVIIVILFLFLIMNQVPSKRALRIARKIHGEEASFPLIGHVFTLMTLKVDDVFDYLEHLLKDYPRLCRFEVAGILNIMMDQAEDIQSVIGNVQHIQKGKEYVPLEPWLKEGLLTSFGNKWHFRRKLLTPTFHFKILRDSVENINRNSEILAQMLLRTRGKEVGVLEFISKCALDIIGESAMGIRIEAQSGIGKSYLESVKTTCGCMTERILKVWQYKMWIFSLSHNGRSFFKSVKTLHDFTKKILAERKINWTNNEDSKTNHQIIEPKSSEESTSEGKVRRVFLDALLEVQQNNPGTITDEDICEEVDTFMFEGHDTVSAAISFALFLLGHHPREQSLVMKELDTIFGESDREITMEDTHKLIYMDKVIKESLRLYPSVPYMSRLLTQDCVLHDGVVIPETANVIIPTVIVHRNERFFPNPHKFDPERFSEEKCLNRHPYAYLPFSAGPRNCIGQKFAMLEMKVTLSNILRRVRVESVTRRDEFKVLPTFIIRPTKPLICKFFPKQPLYY